MFHYFNLYDSNGNNDKINATEQKGSFSKDKFKACTWFNRDTVF